MMNQVSTSTVRQYLKAVATVHIGKSNHCSTKSAAGNMTLTEKPRYGGQRTGYANHRHKCVTCDSNRRLPMCYYITWHVIRTSNNATVYTWGKSRSSYTLFFFFVGLRARCHCISGSSCKRPSWHRVSLLSCVCKQMLRWFPSSKLILRASHVAAVIQINQNTTPLPLRPPNFTSKLCNSLFIQKP
jgi:hypothetical protein